jgi:hypothetical protein
VFFLGALLGAALAGPGLEAEGAERKGPLAGLPGKPGKQLAKVKALGDDSWLALGAPAADPKWGKARGRSWAARMAFAADLGGAFLFGEGVHGYTKPDGHYMDDLWFYDANAHRWVCCYPGANTKTIELKVDADGFEATKDGERVPVADMGHAYEMLTYDSHRKQFLFMPCPAGYGKVLNEKRKAWWKDKPRPARKGASPWTFDVATGKWDRQATTTKSPASSFGDALVYVPSLKKSFFWHRDGVWFYDGATKKWEQAAAKGAKLPFGIDATCCLDTKRDRIYLGGGSYPVTPKGSNAFFYYDLKKNVWVDPKPKGQPCGGSNSYNTNVAAMNYDAAGDVVVLFRFEGSDEERGMYVYDPKANAWSKQKSEMPKKWGRCRSAFYDANVNAHFVFAAGDSRDDGAVWAYRFKKGK